MTTELILRYFHFASIFTIVGTLVSEYSMLESTLTRKSIQRLSKLDQVYGLAALSLLCVGLTLWLGGYGKPSEFYSGNPIFHLKLALFIAVGLLSIYPTVFFIKNRQGDPHEIVAIPTSIFWMIRLEILLLFTIPILAGLMAKGIGL
jgi:putative membrane protein